VSYDDPGDEDYRPDRMVSVCLVSLVLVAVIFALMWLIGRLFG